MHRRGFCVFAALLAALTAVDAAPAPVKPNIDRMAAEGTRFTSFHVASGVCTPSRAALMTGCYPRRVDMHVSDRGAVVLQPLARKGLHPDETTIAEVLKSAGYVTGIFGKWHLGDQPPFLPTRQGFDEWFGIPYPDVVKRLTALAEKIRGDIGDDDKPGGGQRPAGHVDDPVPLRLQETKPAR